MGEQEGLPANSRPHLRGGLSQKKWPLSRIAAHLGSSKSWVSKWIQRYKELGLHGLFDAPRSGAKKKLTPKQEACLSQRLQAGPTSQDRVSVFRGWSIKDLVRQSFGVEYSLSAIFALLKRLNFRRLKPRPRHEKNDKPLMQQWKEKTFPHKLQQVRAAHPDKKVEVWFQDEMRYGRMTRMTYEWKLCGSQHQRIKQLGSENRYVYGAVQPDTGKRVGLVLSGCGFEEMNIHLSLIAQEIGENAHGLLVMDGAGWHSRCKGLIVPKNITILDLPPYSPELNPVERVWKWLKDNFLSNRVIEDSDDLLQVGCDLWNKLSCEKVKSICASNLS